MTATQPSVCGVTIDSLSSRLIAADLAQEQGNMALANALRDTDRPLVLRNGESTWRTVYEAGKPGTGADYAKRVLKAIGSRKRKLAVVVGAKVHLTGRYWDGGSKSDYTTFSLTSMRTGMRYADVNPLREVDTGVESTEPSMAILVTGTFCGKDATPCLHLHPDDAHLFGLDYIPAYPSTDVAQA